MKRIRFISLIIISFMLSGIAFATPYTDKNLPKAPKVEGRPSVALVLAGGGALGFAQLPIMKLIDELDIPVDLVIGTSVGSIIGGLYASGYSAEEIISEFSEVNWPELFSDNAKSPYEKMLGDQSIYENPINLTFGMDFTAKFGRGVSKGQNIYKLLKSLTLKYPSNIDFNTLPIPFMSVATNMITGETTLLHDGDIADAIRSSMSIPGFFDPYEIDGNFYVDGWLKDNLATDIARKMGYDIVIAIDISADTEKDTSVYDSNPAVAASSILTIAQIEKVTANRNLADLTIYPCIEGFTSLDYLKSEMIYKSGSKDLEKNRESLENLRKKIFPGDYDKDGNRIRTTLVTKYKPSYNSKEKLVLSDIQIHGILEQDRRYINKAFKKLQGKSLDRDSFGAFMDTIFLTGNYLYIKPKFIQQDDKIVLDLNLIQKRAKTINVLLGLDMNQSFCNRETTCIDLNGALQLRGLTGIGSVLSVSGTCIGDLKAELYYLQPFNPYFFLEFNLNYLTKRFTDQPFSRDEASTSRTYSLFSSSIYAGGRTNFGNLIKIGGFFNMQDKSFLAASFNPYYFVLDEENTIEWLNKRKSYSTGLELIYDYSNLDYEVFATKGLDFYFTDKLVFPFDYNFNSYRPGLLTTIEGRGVLPVTKNLSVDARCFFGTDVTNNLTKNVFLFPFEGFSDYNRIYFPQNTLHTYGSFSMLAGSLSIQYSPAPYLTILGGEAIIRLTGTVGLSGLSINDMFEHTYNEQSFQGDISKIKNNYILWTASIGAGLRINPQFGLYVRGGFCNTYDNNFTGFFALDLGSIQF